MGAVNSDQQPKDEASRSDCVGPSPTLTTSYLFLALDTGMIINRAQFTEIPMTAGVIARVIELGSGEPELLTWVNRRGENIGDGPSWSTMETSTAMLVLPAPTRERRRMTMTMSSLLLKGIVERCLPQTSMLPITS